MPMPTIRPRSIAAGVGATLTAAALVLLAPTAASAHVHVTPSTAEAGATSELAFSFSHGCDGSPTTAVAVTIPDEVAAVSLIANPGWDVAVDTAGGGRVVEFTADEPLPDGVRETLELEVTLPDDAADGTVLAFPALQSCEAGATDWRSLDQDADAPAPILTIGATAPDADGTGAHAAVTPDAEPAAVMPIAIAALAVALVAVVLAAVAALRRRPTA